MWPYLVAEDTTEAGVMPILQKQILGREEKMKEIEDRIRTYNRIYAYFYLPPPDRPPKNTGESSSCISSPAPTVRQGVRRGPDESGTP
jgi:hypothetical protein